MAVRTTTPRIETLESVRGLAALLIVFFHFPGWNSVPFSIQVIQHGYLMVQLFFVLSGFVIFHAYGERIKDWKDICRFQFLRFGRLYPVHLLFLLVFLVIEIAKSFAVTNFNVVIPNSAPFRENNWTAFLQQLALVQDIGPTGNALTFNIPAWSISVEFYTYLIFALVVFWLPRVKLWAFAGIALASLLALSLETTFGFKDLLLCNAGFFLGCLTGSFSIHAKWLQTPYSGLIFLAGIIMLLQLKAGVAIDIMIFPLTVGLILSLSSCRSGWLHQVLSIRALVWLGGISYSLYMSHETVLWVTNQLFRMVLKRPEVVAGGRSVPQLSDAEALFAYPLALIAVIAVAYVTFRFVEAPLRKKSRNVLKRI